MYGAAEIIQYLNVPAITGLLGTYATGKKNLLDTNVLPKTATGNAINIYQSVPHSPDLVLINTFTANCRSDSYANAQALAKAASDILHRLSKDGIGIYCKILPVIPPADSRDDYNVPVEIRIKKR